MNRKNVTEKRRLPDSVIPDLLDLKYSRFGFIRYKTRELVLKMREQYYHPLL